MQTYIVRVYRVRPEDTGSVSGVIEGVESGQKEPFHNINELQTMLADSIGKGQLESPNLVTRELNTHDNVAGGGRYLRELLEKRVMHLRLGEMLAKRRINLRHYVSSQSVAVLAKNIHNCKQCRNSDKCDHYLHNQEIDDGIELSFCPNNDSINIIRNQQSYHSRVSVRQNVSHAN